MTVNNRTSRKLTRHVTMFKEQCTVSHATRYHGTIRGSVWIEQAVDFSTHNPPSMNNSASPTRCSTGTRSL
jgi:hypothetical protein